MKYLLVYLVMTLTDIVWARYTAAIANDSAAWAGVWSVGIILFGSFVTIAYVNDAWALIPAACGAFTGTYLSVKVKVVGWKLKWNSVAQH